MSYVPGRVAAKTLGVHQNTLRRWASEGKIKYIRTESGQRRYNVRDYLKEKEVLKVCYCRVSSYKQKDDLQRQVEFMQSEFPGYEIVRDVGSGLNWNRKGLKSILEQAMSGTCVELVVAHRDRLCRFGFELVEWIIERTGGRIVVLRQTSLSPNEELVADLLSIIHVFSCRLHGLRSYKNKIKQVASKSAAEK